MVRTYAFNASSRSEFFEQFKHTAAAPAPRYNNDNFNSSRSQDTGTRNYSNSNDNRKYNTSDSQSISNSVTSNSTTLSTSSQSSNQENNNQFINTQFPPLNQSNIYQSSFHSSMIDPIGSIVGLRLIYMNGQLVYVPVEPHINMMINKQFGGGQNAVPGFSSMGLPQIQSNLPIISQNSFPNSQPNSGQMNVPTLSHPSQMVRSQSKQDLNSNENRSEQPYNQSRQFASQQYKNNAMLSKFGSLPNLSQKPFLSSQEQHKLELQQQIEDNKRRREMEKQKEMELEQREIRRFEEYQKQIRMEDEREKRQIQEKARAIELRNQHVYEKQQNQAMNRRKERRPSVPQQQQQQQYYQEYREEEEPIRPAQRMRNSNSFTEYAQQRPNSRPLRDPQPRYEQQQSQQQYDRMAKEPRPDSSQPRQVEWWEKKPSWQDRTTDRQSAVIPTLRGKPPAVPDSQRSGYDSSGNVGEHQSRPSSRTTSSSQRSSDFSHSEEPPVGRQASGARKAPTAFTIDA